MRNEHSEIMHSISKFDRRIDQLERENWYLKSIVEGKYKESQQTSSLNRVITISEDFENNDDQQPKSYIGDSFPKTQHSTESRCMPFKPQNKLKTCQSSDKLDTNNLTTQKQDTFEGDRVTKRRFLIPKP